MNVKVIKGDDSMEMEKKVYTSRVVGLASYFDAEKKQEVNC